MIYQTQKRTRADNRCPIETADRRLARNIFDKIAAQFARLGRLFLCLAAIFTKRVSYSEAGQAKTQHCNQFTNIHMAQPSFLRFPCGFLCKRRGALRLVDASSAPTETECKTHSLRRGLTAYHPDSLRLIVTYLSRNFNLNYKLITFFICLFYPIFKT